MVLHNAPTEHLFPVFKFRNDALSTREAIENVLGISLSDAELHGLLLAEWNKSVCLEAASEYGKQKSVDEMKTVLEGLVNNLEEEGD